MSNLMQNPSGQTTHVVLKFPVDLDESTVDLPIHAEILRVDEQNGKVYLWARVLKPEGAIEPVKIFVAGTGQDIKVDRSYYPCFINTFFIANKTGVFHAFELKYISENNIYER